MPEPTVAPPSPMVPKPGNPIPAGSTAPAVTAPQNAGLAARVPMLMDSAMKQMMEALKFADPMTEEGQIILKMMEMGAKHFGKPSGDLSRADLKLQGENAGPVSPAKPAAWADMMRQTNA